MPTSNYRLADGTPVSGVTTIIGGNLGWKAGGLIHWAWKLGKEGKDYKQVRDDAADAGTVAHAMAEEHIHGRSYEPQGIDAETLRLAEAAFGGYLMWEEQSRVQLIATEVAMVSEEWRYGGTIDAIGLLGGKLALLDWKASNAIYPDYLLQLAAYRHLFTEVTGLVLDGGSHLLRFAKDGSGFMHRWWPPDALNGAWEAFRCLRSLHDLKKPLEKIAR